MTVAEIREIFESFKDETIDDQRFYKWLNYIDHWLYEDLSRIDPERFIAEQTLTVSESTTNYDLPDNFGHINHQSCGLFVLTDGAVSSKLKTTVYAAEAQGFFFQDDQVCFTGGVNGSILLRYIPERIELSSEDDSLVASAKFTEFYEQALDYYYAIDDDELEDEANCQTRMQAKLAELLKNYNRDQKTLDINMSHLY